MREVRKLTTSGHQVSLISTAYGASGLEDCVRLFSRWSQENFFHYMMQHFAIDLLNEYGTEEIPETKRPVVNPRWRELDRQKQSSQVQADPSASPLCRPDDCTRNPTSRRRPNGRNARRNWWKRSSSSNTN